MKHVSDMTRDVYSLINIPDVTEGITGKVWEDLMSSSSKSTVNIVVKGISLTNKAIQNGYTHVNIYAPNLTIDGDPNFPNRPELYRVRDLVFPLLNSIYKPSFQIWVDEADGILTDKDGNWYLGIILGYQSIQL